MLNTKCIRYSVDPSLLNQGIPIEQLEKRNVQEFQSGETIEHLKRYSQGTQRLCGLKTAEHYPKPVEKELEIELGLSDFSKVKSGQSIKIDDAIAVHQGKKFKIKNKGTTSYIRRILVVVGDRGYFQ